MENILVMLYVKTKLEFIITRTQKVSGRIDRAQLTWFYRLHCRIAGEITIALIKNINIKVVCKY